MLFGCTILKGPIIPDGGDCAMFAISQLMTDEMTNHMNAIIKEFNTDSTFTKHPSPTTLRKLYAGSDINYVVSERINGANSSFKGSLGIFNKYTRYHNNLNGISETSNIIEEEKELKEGEVHDFKNIYTKMDRKRGAKESSTPLFNDTKYDFNEITHQSIYNGLVLKYISLFGQGKKDLVESANAN